MRCEVFDALPRRRGRAGLVLAVMLAGASMQGCCDPTVAMATSSMGESSSTSDGGSTEPTSTGEPALPEWAIGVFSTESDQVGMSFMDQPYGWANVEITATDTLFLDWYTCSVHRERQEFRWTSTDGGQSLTLEPVPPADVFTYGAGHQVSDVVVEPGDSCDTIIIHWFHIEAMAWFADELQRGDVCPRATGPDGCTFTFEWCDGVSPPACE
jgi:hypothetical protein